MGKRPFSDKKGAAQYCHTTVRHIERVRSERRLAYIKVGSKVRLEQRTSLLCSIADAWRRCGEPRNAAAVSIAAERNGPVTSVGYVKSHLK